MLHPRLIGYSIYEVKNAEDIIYKVIYIGETSDNYNFSIQFNNGKQVPIRCNKADFSCPIDIDSDVRSVVMNIQQYLKTLKGRKSN